MTKEERLQRALKYNDFYELALLTYENSKNMTSELDKSLKNKNLSESEKRMKEIAKECGLKRMI